MNKQAATIITSLRILGSIGILFCPVFSIPFYVLYLFCGLTDMVDGTIARKTNTVSEFGARLDTAADLLFTAVALLKILPVIQIQAWLLIWIATIAVIKLFNLTWGFLRRKKLPSLHTIANKFTGLCLFLLPLTMPFVDMRNTTPVVCIIATVAAVQEGYYIGTDRNIV